jgi:acyl-CoA synthetase (AMP-forming)/AMP-acid ligase II
VPGVRLEIIAVSDVPIAEWDESLRLPDGEIGEIIVQGPQVTVSYFHRPDSTALAKIADPAGGFFHRMGDLGYRDAQGRIWFCGRKTHRVITATGTLFTVPCEALFNTHKQVFRSALVGIDVPGRQRPVICIETEAAIPRSEHPRLRTELLKIAEGNQQTAGIRDILFHPSFPVDIRHNAKIFREKLALWAAKELA